MTFQERALLERKRLRFHLKELGTLGEDMRVSRLIRNRISTVWYLKENGPQRLILLNVPFPVCGPV